MTSSTKLYNSLKAKIGEEPASQVIEYIDNHIQEEMAKAKIEVATKADLSEAKVEIIKYLVTVYASGFVALLIAIIGLYFRQ